MTWWKWILFVPLAYAAFVWFAIKWQDWIDGVRR